MPDPGDYTSLPADASGVFDLGLQGYTYENVYIRSIVVERLEDIYPINGEQGSPRQKVFRNPGVKITINGALLTGKVSTLAGLKKGSIVSITKDVTSTNYKLDEHSIELSGDGTEAMLNMVVSRPDAMADAIDAAAP